MKSLIERQLYRPAVVLPLMGLTRLLVSTDFNLTQAGFVIAMRGSQQMLSFTSTLPATVSAKARQWARRRSDSSATADRVICGDQSSRSDRLDRSALMSRLPSSSRAVGVQASDCCHCSC